MDSSKNALLTHITQFDSNVERLSLEVLFSWHKDFFEKKVIHCAEYDVPV